MPTDGRRKLLASLVRAHFACLVAVPLLGFISRWFLRRPLLPLMLFAGLADYLFD